MSPMPRNGGRYLVYYSSIQDPQAHLGGSAVAAFEFVQGLLESGLASSVDVSGNGVTKRSEYAGASMRPLAEVKSDLPSYDTVVFVSAFDRMNVPKPKGQCWILYSHCWDMEQSELARLAEVDLVLALSEPHRDNLLNKWIGSRTQCRFLPNCIDTALFRPLPVERRSRSLVFSGAVVPHKNVHMLVNVFMALRAHVPGLELHIYGSASLWGDSDEYEKYLSESAGTRVHFHGSVSREQLVEAYSTHGLMCLPSMLENFPLVSLEAQACGCIPLLHDIGGSRATIRAGQTGFLYAPNTEQNLAMAIVQAITTLEARPEMRAAASQYARENYSRATFRDNLLQVLSVPPSF